MEKKYYTAERNVQIVIALLKAHGIKRVIASPGTTNMTFIGSIQQDPYFEIWSSVDERSAAYLACGMAAETGEPVVISCTGATASRNYMPGMTEAYYRKLPVLAITSHRGEHQIGHLLDQQIDRRTIPNDVAMCSVTVPLAKTPIEEKYCEIEANKAMLALSHRGGGPAHINMYTEYNKDFSVKELPTARAIFRYTYFDKLPELPKNGKIGINLGSHHNFTKEETEAIDKFCASNNAVVFCDSTGGYIGKYAVPFHLVNGQVNYVSPLKNLDLMIHIGEVSATFHVMAKEVWRVSEDGEIRDTFGKLTKVFEIPEPVFFNHYSNDDGEHTEFLDQCKAEYKKVLNALPELPFGIAWMAQTLMPKMPNGCEIHMGIYNSIRSCSFFEWNGGILGKCNVGGFGIDGALSTAIGASLVRPDKLFYCILGDLAFFYDMNVAGNRHVGNNIRILVNNNSKGAEFRLFNHPCSAFGEDADKFMAAAGHYGAKSPSLVKGYAEALGYEYLSASTKEEFLSNLEKFLNPKITERPIIFETFSDSDNESEALELIQSACTDTAQNIVRDLKVTAHKILGKSGVDTVKNILGKLK